MDDGKLSIRRKGQIVIHNFRKISSVPQLNKLSNIVSSGTSKLVK